jgi:hypothetical protein
MTKLGRPHTYQSDAEKPVSVSLRIPRDLYEQAQRYVGMRRTTLTELLLDGLRLRLDTPADPRDLLMSYNSNTVMQHIQELVNEAVQVALATGYGPPVHTPARATAAVPTEGMPYYNNNTVIQKRDTTVQEVAPVPQKRRKDAIAEPTLRAIVAERHQYPDMPLRAFCRHLYETGVYRAEGKQGEAKPPSVSLIHRWLGEAKEAGLL